MPLSVFLFFQEKLKNVGNTGHIDWESGNVYCDSSGEPIMGENSEVTEDMMQPALTDPLTTTVVTTKDANENNTKSGKWKRCHWVTYLF